jgi:UPF0755 protein
MRGRLSACGASGVRPSDTARTDTAPGCVRYRPPVLRPLLASAAATLVVGVSSAPAAAPVTLRVSFPEGFTVRRMVDRVAEVRTIAIRKRHVRPVLSGAGYRAAAAATAPPRAFAKDNRRRSLEGFLFPSVYSFGPSTTAGQLIRAQLASFDLAWRGIDLAEPRRRGVSPYGVLTIASMVEREAVAPAERKLIAAVIYNRLAKGMPLGIDATLRYGLGIEGTRPITAAQLKNQTPYNTSIHKGLPPTPIGNPGVASMQAAAHPAALDYLYYVRKPDGIHHFFTADEAEFCRKAQEYGYHC